jgi:ribose-phosphate pyrophosphokinase
MTPELFIPLPGNETMAAALAERLGAELGALETRQFPDGESYVRILTPVIGRAVVFVCTLAQPDAKFLPLLFTAAAARELGARNVGLCAPYLAYMRQDRRFQPGEAVTSRHAAALLSNAFDWLVCIDPHLHRYRALAEIYSIPALALHAAPLLSDWIVSRIPDPVLIGPDAESEQWVHAVAQAAGVPFTVLEKTRLGDRVVEIKVRHMERLARRTPVLLDDIISSGHTMLEAVRQLRTYVPAPPVCLAIHGLFAEGADVALEEAGARLATTNTVPHRSNVIDVAGLLASAMARTP